MPAGNPEAYAQPGPDQGGPEQAMEAMKAIQDAMMSLMEGGKQSGMPPEALDALGQANDAYGQFLDIVTGNAAPKGPVAPEMAQGGAVPVR